MRSTKLYAAIQAKNVTQVEQILQIEPAVLKKQSKEGHNFLHAAAIVGSVEICNLIMQAEAEHRTDLHLDEPFSEEFADNYLTPLDCAVCHSQIDVVRMFLNLGHSVFGNQSIVLCRASIKCQSEEMWDLLLEKAPVDFFATRLAADLMSKAATFGNIFVIQYLRKRGVDIHQANALLNFSLLHDAASGKQLEVIKLLVALGLDINDFHVVPAGFLTAARIETALHAAATTGAKDIVRYLLAHGADGSLNDSKQRKAYELGCFAEFWEAGYPSYPSRRMRLGMVYADLLFMHEMDVDTTPPHIFEAVFPYDQTPLGLNTNRKFKDPTSFYRTILTNIHIIHHDVRQRLLIDTISINVDLAVIMVQDYQDQPHDGDVACAKMRWPDVIRLALDSLLRSRALPDFKTIAVAAQWDIDSTTFYQVNKSKKRHEQVTFFHEVVSGRFNLLTSDNKKKSWSYRSPHYVEKIALPIIKFLVKEIGADVNGNTSDCHVKPLFEAVRAAAPLPVIKLLLELGANVNGRNWKGGRTALHAFCDNVLINSDEFSDALVTETAELLLQAGADQECQDDNGITPKDILTRPDWKENLGNVGQRACDRVLLMMSRNSVAPAERREGR